MRLLTAIPHRALASVNKASWSLNKTRAPFHPAGMRQKTPVMIHNLLPPVMSEILRTMDDVRTDPTRVLICDFESL